MTEATRFKSWQKAGAPAAPHNVKSPNLVQLVAYARRTWGLVNLGIYNHRPIRGGTAWSSHAFGAAADLGYTDRHALDNTVLPFLIVHSQELGIQRIHDYQRKRYWEAGKGWVNKSPGEGFAWIHVETHVDDWENDTPIEARLSTATPMPPARPYPGKPVKRGATNNREDVKAIQHVVGVIMDGKFGVVTEASVRNWQTLHDLKADGVVGPITWARMFG
jgi:peptidoglycan hydrolase-like protein with peptidoglycan-binding domain